jgi:hypothetical protein
MWPQIVYTMVPHRIVEMVITKMFDLKMSCKIWVVMEMIPCKEIDWLD